LQILVNAVQVWNARYMTASIDHLHATKPDVVADEIAVARVAPVTHAHFNSLGRYDLHRPAAKHLRPLRRGVDSDGVMVKLADVVRTAHDGGERDERAELRVRGLIGERGRAGERRVELAWSDLAEAPAQDRVDGAHVGVFAGASEGVQRWPASGTKYHARSRTDSTSRNASSIAVSASSRRPSSLRNVDWLFSDARVGEPVGEQIEQSATATGKSTVLVCV
jgi:hypothetical protein